MHLSLFIYSSILLNSVISTVRYVHKKQVFIINKYIFGNTLPQIEMKPITREQPWRTYEHTLYIFKNSCYYFCRDLININHLISQVTNAMLLLNNNSNMHLCCLNILIIRLQQQSCQIAQQDGTIIKKLVLTIISLCVIVDYDKNDDNYDC